MSSQYDENDDFNEDDQMPDEEVETVRSIDEDDPLFHDTVTSILTKRLDEDARAAVRTLNPRQIRYIVNLYYDIQGVRVGTGNRTGAAKRNKERASGTLIELYGGLLAVEQKAYAVMDLWTSEQPACIWSRQVIGIGPVISAGLRSYLDISTAPTVGHWWSFAGLNPEMVWAKGQKRPYSAKLKVLVAYKLGESFVKVSGKEGSVYGRLWRQRKDREIARNEAGEFVEYAANVLATKRYDRNTEAYKALSVGRLPKAQIHARARRYAAKIFLSHYHEAVYRLELNQRPPLPFAIAHLGHGHVIDPEVPYPAI